MSRRGWGLVAAVLAALLLLGALLWYFLYPRPPRLTLASAVYGQFNGWKDDHSAEAVPAFLQSCAALAKKPDDALLDRPQADAFGRAADWRDVCTEAAALPSGDDRAARRFFETAFVPELAGNNGDPEGLFTGYFELTLDGARRRGGPYQTPLYRRPSDPALRGKTRAEIEDGALAGKGLELIWVKDPVAAFFLEIQGSGLVKLPNGGIVRIGYDGSNGKPYVAVGRLLVERGEIAREQATMQSIRAWMVAHPQQAAALRRENPSYVFFHELTGPGPLGAERVPLTAGRSLAVDRRFIALGVPIWLEARQRYSEGEIRRLVIAQDTGGAIRGPVRGDLFWGHGDTAAEKAGAMNARGRYYLLLPKAVAARQLE